MLLGRVWLKTGQMGTNSYEKNDKGIFEIAILVKT